MGIGCIGCMYDRENRKMNSRKMYFSGLQVAISVAQQLLYVALALDACVVAFEHATLQRSCCSKADAGELRLGTILS
jgi:hypothetical protein